VNIEPVYKTFAGWEENLENVNDFDDLPQSLKDYILFIEREVGVPVNLISVGPDRKQTLKRN
jgi:adenylosuccinate synthase